VREPKTRRNAYFHTQFFSDDPVKAEKKSSNSENSRCRQEAFEERSMKIAG